jgi:uncharacterized membrane protein YqjE
MRMNGEGARSPGGGSGSGWTTAPIAARAPKPESESPPEALSSAALLKEIAREVQHLVKAQIELARVEVRANVAAEAKTAAGLGIGALTALMGVNLLLVTAIFALATVLPGWAAGLVVSGVVLAAAAIIGAIGWRRRVRRPLGRTRNEIQEEVKWTKERVS